MKKLFLLLSLVTLNAAGSEILPVGSREQKPDEPYQRDTYTTQKLEEASEIAKRQQKEWEQFAQTVDSAQVMQDKQNHGPIHDNAFFLKLHLPLLKGAGSASSQFGSKHLNVTQCPHTAIDLLPFILHDGAYRLIIISKYIHRLQKEKYATVGGITEYGETFEQTATREAKEEAHLNLDPKLLFLLGTKSDPNRDPRGRHITSIYYGCISTEMPKPSDEAYRVFLATKKGIEETNPEEWCAPDHKEMALEAFARLDEIIKHNQEKQFKQ